MKRILFIALFTVFSGIVYAQEPIIEGDLMLCPYDDGTAEITNGVEYDSYQWYFKYWFLEEDEFEPIEGATEASFTYDWFTYDQALLKVVVTLDGETYESNELQIDSYAWAGFIIIVEPSEDVIGDPETESYLICEGSTITLTINQPYDTNIQWYKDDEPIEGANEQTYVITEPGSYYGEAAPSFCPDVSNNNAGQATVVVMNPDCVLSTPDFGTENNFTMYPVPAQNVLNISTSQNTVLEDYTIADITGKTIATGKFTGTDTSIDVSGFAQGTYIIKATSNQNQVTKMFIKN